MLKLCRKFQKLTNKYLKISSYVKMSTSNRIENKTKYLAAFDFDCTIVDGFCDNAARNLLPADKVPKYKMEGWAIYMKHIFKLLNSYNIEKSVIENAIFKMEPVDGMYELLQELCTNPNFDVIIISDCNSHFIKIWLEHYKLHNIRKIISNPAYFSDGLLNVEMYKLQNTCLLSEKGLCKGDALENYIMDQNQNGITYKHVAFVGDGFNDFCPMLRLRDCDLACSRQGFECAEAVINTLNGVEVQNKLYSVKANAVFWSNGFDIRKAFQQSLQ